MIHPDNSTPFLSIVIPCYNEEKRLPATIQRIQEFEKNVPFPIEIIFVDDGSKDETGGILERSKKHNASWKVILVGRNQGKGAAVKIGMLNARGAYCLYSDTDLSTPLEQVFEFFPFMKKLSLGGEEELMEFEKKYQVGEKGNYDGIIGSRRIKGANLIPDQPARRKLMGFVFRQLVRWIVMPGFVDTQCGFKMFTREASRKIFEHVSMPGFSFDVEALFIASKLGYKIKEAPVTWSDSTPTTVRLIRDPVKMLWDLFTIRFR